MLSQDDFLSPEIEACLNDAERGASTARGPAPSVQHSHSAGPGSSAGVPAAVPVAPPQHHHIQQTPAERTATGTQQPSANSHQPLPPPPGPPPLQQQQPIVPVAKMKPNAERSCNFHNHRATKSVGKGFETTPGSTSQDAGSSAPHKYLMNGTMPRMQDYDAYQKLCAQILGADDTQRVQGKSFIKKSGWRKLAMAFQISFQILDSQITYNDQGNVRMASFTVRGMLPCGRFADSWGGCDALEKRFSKPNHDVPATAETRAKNRACADLLGLCYSASKPKG